MISRLAQRRRRRLLIYGAILLLLLLILFVGCLWVSYTSLLRVTAVSVTGNDAIPASSVEDVVMHNMTGRYLGIFSRSNVLFYPKQTIKHDLMSLYPTMLSVAIHAEDFHTISVAITERTPSALWCPGSDIASTTSVRTCVLLDINGLAYANAVEDPSASMQHYSGALANGSLPKQFLPSGQFHSLSALVAAFEQKIAPVTIETVSIDENNDAHLHTSVGCDIMFALAQDSGDIFQHFALALTSSPLAQHTLSDFTYIDLRFGDKVYYKHKN